MARTRKIFVVLKKVFLGKDKEQKEVKNIYYFLSFLLFGFFVWIFISFLIYIITDNNPLPRYYQHFILKEWPDKITNDGYTWINSKLIKKVDNFLYFFEETDKNSFFYLKPTFTYICTLLGLCYFIYYIPRRSIFCFIIINFILIMFFIFVFNYMRVFIIDRIQNHTKLPIEMIDFIKPDRGEVIILNTYPYNLDIRNFYIIMQTKQKEKEKVYNPKNNKRPDIIKEKVEILSTNLPQFIIFYLYFGGFLFYVYTLIKLRIWIDFKYLFLER